MRRNSDNPNEKRFRRDRRTLLVLVLCVAASAGMAEASPIRHHQISSESAPKPSAWNEFLDGGPELWASAQPPTIGTEIHHIMNHALKSADPTANLNVEYLMWRQSLDPVRFDRYHPRVGRELRSMLTPTSVSPTANPGGALEPEQLIPPTSTSTPATPSSSTSTSTLPSPSATAPEVLAPTASTSAAPAAIPEPETMTIALVLIGSGLWWRARHRSGSRLPQVC